jgi:hypothetical protein
MKVILRAQLVTDWGEVTEVDVAEFSRPARALNADTLGLSLTDGKALLNRLQQTIASAQAEELCEHSVDPGFSRSGRACRPRQSRASQFTLWLGANLQITAIVTGALAVVLGGDVFWSLIALLAGQLLGGAVIPIVAVCLMYVGFSASGSVLAGQAIGQLLRVDDSAISFAFPNNRPTPNMTAVTARYIGFRT